MRNLICIRTCLKPINILRKALIVIVSDVDAILLLFNQLSELIIQ